jgi:hypothetical protein
LISHRIELPLRVELRGRDDWVPRPVSGWYRQRMRLYELTTGSTYSGKSTFEMRRAGLAKLAYCVSA